MIIKGDQYVLVTYKLYNKNKPIQSVIIVTNSYDPESEKSVDEYKGAQAYVRYPVEFREHIPYGGYYEVFNAAIKFYAEKWGVKQTTMRQRIICDYIIRKTHAVVLPV